MNALKTVADIMTRKVVAVSENDTLEKLEESMRQFDFNHLPVVEGKKLIGLISHGDLLHASSSFLSDMAEERNKLINKVKVGVIMQRELITVGPEEPLQSAGTMMLEANVRCLPVVTDGDTLVGMVTGGDFIRLAIVLLDQRARGSTPPPPDQRAKGSTPPPPPNQRAKGSTPPPPPATTPPPLPRQKKGTLPPPSRRVIALRDAAAGRVADINALDAAAARKAAEMARKEASAAQKEAAAAKKAAAAAQKEVDAVKKEVEVAKKEAEAAKQEAEAARREAEAAEKEAVAARKEAEATKKEAAAQE